MFTQTKVSDILQISGGMLTNVSKKRKIEEGNLQKVKVTILRHLGGRILHNIPENSEADVVIAACTCL